MYKRRGFSLIELLIAITIIAIISTVGFSTFSQSQMRARDAKRKEDLKAITIALELFYQKNGRYPCSAASGWISSTSGGNWLTDQAGCASFTATGSLVPNYINAFPLDPINTPGAGSNPDVYSYSYSSPNNTGNGSATCPIGQHYILFAHLENTNDPDVISRKVLPWCGATNFWTQVAASGTNFSSNSYMLVAP